MQNAKCKMQNAKCNLLMKKINIKLLLILPIAKHFLLILILVAFTEAGIINIIY
jgi:hypothetical protein